MGCVTSEQTTTNSHRLPARYYLFVIIEIHLFNYFYVSCHVLSLVTITNHLDIITVQRFHYLGSIHYTAALLRRLKNLQFCRWFRGARQLASVQGRSKTILGPSARRGFLPRRPRLLAWRRSCRPSESSTGGERSRCTCGLPVLVPGPPARADTESRRQVTGEERGVLSVAVLEQEAVYSSGVEREFVILILWKAEPLSNIDGLRFFKERMPSECRLEGIENNNDWDWKRDGMEL